MSAGCKQSNQKAAETPLHLAAKTNTPEGRVLIESLAAEGADVNAKNMWQQTPLHYAAIAESPQNIETLLNISSIDVNIRDVNGYNALQCLIAANNGKEGYSQIVAIANFLEERKISDNPEGVEIAEDPKSKVSSDLRKAIGLLVHAGTDLNNQTVFGYSILHLAARRLDSTALLKHFIFNYPDINLNLTNEMGENFLHSYDNKASFEKTFEFLDWISEKYESRLSGLLSTKNVLGKTPWTLMIRAGLTLKNLKKIFSYGVSSDSNDTLGNTVLHRASAISERTPNSEVVKYLIELSGDTNARNIYGEPAISMILFENILEVFLQFNIDWNIKDRWSRSPLISIMKYRPTIELLSNLIETGNVDINTRDVYGSTPLHYAAYQNYEEQVNTLLKYKANINVLDELQEKPVDTAKRNRSFRCLALLKSADIAFEEKVPCSSVEILYSRNRTLEDFLQEMPKSIASSRIQTAQDIQRLLALPRDLNLFVNNLMESFYTRNPKYVSEVEAIVFEVNSLVTSLCKQIEKYDSRFGMSVFPSGSMAEGTKIDRPNEFDFILCLNKLNDITDIVTEDIETGFACLKFKQDRIADDSLLFTDADGYFLPSPFLQYFFIYLQKALHEPYMWRKGNLYFNFENKFGSLPGKPVFTFDVIWLGSVHKQLEISVDLVPAVYKKGWWPPNIDIEKLTIANDITKASGCFLTLQAQSHQSVGLELQDCVGRTCNPEVSKNECIRNRVLRISAAPAEISQMKSLPNNFRNAYVLAKILKSTCPEIDVETKQYKLERYELEYSNPRRTIPSDLIKSYMLKNAVFYVFEKFKMENSLLEGIEVSQITAEIYRYLLSFIQDLKFCGYMHMRPYFLSGEYNVFKNPKDLSVNKRFIHQLQSEFCIKLILGILNEQFPKEVLATNVLLPEGIFPLVVNVSALA